MLQRYNFDRLADRSQDYSKKWDKDFITSKYGDVPDDYLSMWIADLDYEVAPPIYQKFKEIVEKKTFGYTYVYDDFYKSIQNYLSIKINKVYPKESILLDYSIVSSLYHSVQAFTQEGETILVNTPVYNPFRNAAKENNRYIVENKLIINESGRYEIDFEVLENQIKEYQPKMYIMCSPHNPGGTIWGLEIITKIAKICMKYQMILVVDEAHSEHINNGVFSSILSLDDALLKNVIYLNSPNKPFNVAGLKTSYVIIPNIEIRAQFEKNLRKNNVDEPNIFGIAGIIAAYSDEGMEWLHQNYQYILENYAWVESFVRERLPQCTLMPLDSTYVIWLDVSRTGMYGNQFTQQLAQETGVLLQAGSDFGDAGKRFVRINLGTSKENVREAFNRIADWVVSVKINPKKALDSMQFK